MPTGYTADIAKGITFNKFVWDCARAFGALMSMRDDPVGTPIPERFEPSPFYLENVEKAERELARLQSLTFEQAQSESIEAYDHAHQAWVRRRHDRNDLRNKYEAMLRDVETWQPPTTDHVELKAFMSKQILESISFDCSHKYDNEPKQADPKVWLAMQIEKAKKDLAYAVKSHQEEVERIRSRNEWLKALRESVPPPAKED